MSRAFQNSASNPRQVRYAKRKAEQRAARFIDSLRAVMQTPEGRIVCWELLTRAGIYRSVWDPGAKIHYNAGKQDYGHELLAAIVEADEAAYQLMEREQRAFAKSTDRETAAVQQDAAADEEGNV